MVYALTMGPNLAVLRLRALPGFLLLCSFAAAKTLPVVLQKSGQVQTENLPLSGVQPGHRYSILYSLDSLRDLRPDSRVDVEVRQGGEVLVGKVLHAGDADLYAQFRSAKQFLLKAMTRNTFRCPALPARRWSTAPI